MDKLDMWLWYVSLVEEENGMGLKQFDTSYKIEKLYKADEKETEEKYGFTVKECEALMKAKNDGRVEKLRERMDRNGISLITEEDESFPKRLKKIKDVRYLFYKGSLPKDDELTVGMVGARACSAYGRNMAKRIASELAEAGVGIVSGMARGVDTYSHLGAVSKKGKTYAVLGCGVDICYPTENIELYEDILNCEGGIISEYMPGSAPLAWHFPYRNRIISGLSDKVAVIEAREKSGSLITVDWALEQGKDVFALPGRVGDMLSSGCNNLIKNGAGIITEPLDIIREYIDMGDVDITDEADTLCVENRETNICKERKTLTEPSVKNRIKTFLANNTVSLEVLIKELGVERGEVISELMDLQLDGVVEEVSTNYYSLK